MPAEDEPASSTGWARCTALLESSALWQRAVVGGMGLTVCLTGVLLNRSFELARNDSPFMSCPEDWFTTAEAQVRVADVRGLLQDGRSARSPGRIGPLLQLLGRAERRANRRALVVVCTRFSCFATSSSCRRKSDPPGRARPKSPCRRRRAPSCTLSRSRTWSRCRTATRSTQSEAEGLWFGSRGPALRGEHQRRGARLALFYVCISTLLCSVISAQLHFAHPSGPPPQEEQRSTVRGVIPDDIVVSGPSAAKNV